MHIWDSREEAENLGRRFSGINKAKFARDHKVRGGASMISQHISGNRPISLDAAVAYARGLGCTLAEISPRLDLEIKKAKNLTEKELPPNSYLVDTSKISYPPVLGGTMGGLPELIFLGDGSLQNSSDDYGEVYSVDKGAFITMVDGNSMIPKYHHKGYALVEPNTEPEIEDDVLVKLKTGEVMLKRLVSRRGGIVLSSYNDSVIHTLTNDQVAWMYYVAYPVPARKIKSRV